MTPPPSQRRRNVLSVRVCVSHNLISVQSTYITRSSSVVALARHLYNFLITEGRGGGGL